MGDVAANVLRAGKWNYWLSLLSLLLQWIQFDREVNEFHFFSKCPKSARFWAFKADWTLLFWDRRAKQGNKLVKGKKKIIFFVFYSLIWKQQRPYPRVLQTIAVSHKSADTGLSNTWINKSRDWHIDGVANKSSVFFSWVPTFKRYLSKFHDILMFGPRVTVI